MFGNQADDDDDQRRSFSRRALLVGLGQVAAFGALGTKLFQLQVLEATRYAPLADENRINVQLVAPVRGRILDRYGEVLAGNDEGFRAILIPSLAGNVSNVLERFSKIVPITAEERDRFVSRARRQQPNLPLIIANDLDFEQLASINLMAPQLPGIQIEASATRKYLAGDTVGHVVGHVGSVDRVSIDDDPVLRLPGLKIGRSGVERGLDERLRGRSGTIKHEVDARGRIVRTLSQTEPVRGDDVALTIDTQLQRACVARVSRERRASAVAIDVTTGDVVMMVSVPTHDPGALVKGVTKRAWENLREQGNDPMVNRAIRGLYPPGSTFKMVTALAALEAGVINLTTKITCEGQTELGGQIFRCWKRSGHGSCDVHRAMRESCDCFFYETAQKVGIEAIAAMGQRLGLGQTYDTGLAHQKAGVMPDPAWKRGRFNKSWLGGETLLAGIGQGYVLTTPLQLAVMTARIATGRAIVPQIVRPEAGMVPASFGPLGLKPPLIDAIRRGMTAVVNEDGGTGGNARLDDGQPLVAGKTGTSQVSRASADRNGVELSWAQRDHALFVAYVPADKPRYALSVVVEHGGGGGSTAGPVMKDLITEVLARDPANRPSYPDVTGIAPSLRLNPRTKQG